MLTREYVSVPEVPVGTGIIALLPVVVMVWFIPLLIVYVIVYGAVPEAPVNVMSGEGAFWQTTVVPIIVAVGNGFTITVAFPLCN
jgi:hypothetical protein